MLLVYYKCSIIKQWGHIFYHQQRFIFSVLPLNYKIIIMITHIYEFIKQNEIMNITNIAKIRLKLKKEI